jgi:hypothetical protein
MKPRTTKQTGYPNFAGLVALLPTLRHLVDTSATVTLELEEAERIRMMGFDARPGPWWVPPLPADLVAGNPLLEPLANNVDPFWRSRQSESERSHRTEIVEQTPLESALATGGGETPGGATEPSEISDPAASNMESVAILSAINRAGGCVERRKLQKKLWRMGAMAFNHGLEFLKHQGLIQVAGKLLIVQRADPAELAALHVPPRNEDVPQTNDGVPPVESALVLTAAPDQLTNFGGTSQTTPRGR